MVHGTIVEDVAVHDAAQGGVLLVTLTGTKRSLAVSGFAPEAARVRVLSATEPPTLRVEGFAEWKAVSIVDPHNVTVAPPLLSIRANVPLVLREAGALLLASPRTPSFRDVSGAVACSDLRVGKGTPPPPPAPGGVARVLAKPQFTLYEQPGGKPALDLELVESPAKTPLQAYESVGDFVHVRFVGDVFLDAWVKKAAVTEPPNVGFGSIGTVGLGSGWGTSSSPRYAQRDTEVRLGPSATAPRVGILEKGARVVTWGGKSDKDGWREIRIYSSDAREPPGKAFFVMEKDLGAKAP